MNSNSSVTFVKERYREALKNTYVKMQGDYYEVCSKHEKGALKCTQTKLAIMIRCHEKTLSRYINNSIPEEVAHSIAKIFGVNIDYLIGNNDYKTKDDEMRALSDRAISDYKTTISYLNYLMGTQVGLSAYLLVTYKELKKEFDNIKNILVNSNDIRKILKDKNTQNDKEKHLFKVDPAVIFIQKEIEDNLKVNKNLHGVINFNGVTIRITEDTANLLLNHDINLYYEIKINGKEHLISLFKMHTFMNYLNNMCKTAITDLLGSAAFNVLNPDYDGT